MSDKKKKKVAAKKVQKPKKTKVESSTTGGIAVATGSGVAGLYGAYKAKQYITPIVSRGTSKTWSAVKATGGSVYDKVKNPRQTLQSTGHKFGAMKDKLTGKPSRLLPVVSSPGKQARATGDIRKAIVKDPKVGPYVHKDIYQLPSSQKEYSILRSQVGKQNIIPDAIGRPVVGNVNLKDTSKLHLGKVRSGIPTGPRSQATALDVSLSKHQQALYKQAGGKTAVGEKSLIQKPPKKPIGTARAALVSATEDVAKYAQSVKHAFDPKSPGYGAIPDISPSKSGQLKPWKPDTGSGAWKGEDVKLVKTKVDGKNVLKATGGSKTPTISPVIEEVPTPSTYSKVTGHKQQIMGKQKTTLEPDYDRGVYKSGPRKGQAKHTKPVGMTTVVNTRSTDAVKAGEAKKAGWTNPTGAPKKEVKQAAQIRTGLMEKHLGPKRAEFVKQKLKGVGAAVRERGGKILKGVQKTGGVKMMHAALPLAGKASIAGPAMTAADIAGVKYKTAGRALLGEKGAGKQAVGEIKESWKSRKQWMQGNIAASKKRKAKAAAKRKKRQ